MNIIQPETSLPNNNSSTISAEKPLYCTPKIHHFFKEKSYM